MQALLNDVEREAKSAIGEGQTPGFGAVASRTVVGALRWEPFRRGSRAGVLTAGYEAEKYAVSGYAFRGATSSAKDAYAALATKVKDGRIELFFDGAEPNDTLLLLIAVAAKDQDAPLPNVDRLFSNWSFHE